MALSAKKTVMLEKQYLYVKASMGFQLEGTNIEKIWVNTGYYRFLVDNVAKALSNSYINIWYDPNDIDFIAYCSDLFMEEIQNSVVTAVENLETYLQQFAQQNHDDFGEVQDTIDELSEGLSSALQLLVSKGMLFSFDKVDSFVKIISDNFSYSTGLLGSMDVGERKTVAFLGFEGLYPSYGSDNGAVKFCGGFNFGMSLSDSSKSYLICFCGGGVAFLDSSNSSCRIPYDSVVNIWRVS